MAESSVALPFSPGNVPHALPLDVSDAWFAAPLTPLIPVPRARRRSAAEEARTILAGGCVATLATIAAEGDPWASVVTYAVLRDGSPVLCLTHRALHGRNVAADPRASLAVAAPLAMEADPSGVHRVSLAGVVERPTGEQLEQAERTYEAAVPAAELFSAFGDFTYWVLRVRRVRWIGGIGRAESPRAEDFAAASADPVAPFAAAAVDTLNRDHASALVAMARRLSGHPDVHRATCMQLDRYGLDLHLETRRGRTPARICFPAPLAALDAPALVERVVELAPSG